ncbi:hypothetical protein B0H14DRAFT_2583985 [Mycena olivaceomarginata]|nr:hypothetical protein B0H14DRAFT_2583985 [Mycena olivaceomarginata]
MHLAALILTPIFLAAGIASGFTLNTRNALEPPEPLCGGIGTSAFSETPLFATLAIAAVAVRPHRPLDATRHRAAFFKRKTSSPGSVGDRFRRSWRYTLVGG